MWRPRTVHQVFYESYQIPATSATNAKSITANLMVSCPLTFDLNVQEHRFDPPAGNRIDVTHVQPSTETRALAFPAGLAQRLRRMSLSHDI